MNLKVDQAANLVDLSFYWKTDQIWKQRTQGLRPITGWYKWLEGRGGHDTFQQLFDAEAALLLQRSLLRYQLDVGEQWSLQNSILVSCLQFS